MSFSIPTALRRSDSTVRALACSFSVFATTRRAGYLNIRFALTVRLMDCSIGKSIQMEVSSNLVHNL